MKINQTPSFFQLSHRRATENGPQNRNGEGGKKGGGGGGHFVLKV